MINLKPLVMQMWGVGIGTLVVATVAFVAMNRGWSTLGTLALMGITGCMLVAIMAGL